MELCAFFWPSWTITTKITNQEVLTFAKQAKKRFSIRKTFLVTFFIKINKQLTYLIYLIVPKNKSESQTVLIFGV